MFKNKATIPLKDILGFCDELGREIDELKGDIADEFGAEWKMTAQEMAIERLPSGADNTYVNSFVSQRVAGTADSVRMELRNVHQWAEAVEGGTNPHKIPFESRKNLRITKVLPPGPSDYKTKYENTLIYRTKVKHPGARPFWIIRDSLRETEKKKKKIINTAFWKRGW